VVFDEVYVECMGMIGRKHEMNCFFWPQQIKDKCWYQHDKIMDIIPKPTIKEGSFSHFEVSPVLWKTILEKNARQC